MSSFNLPSPSFLLQAGFYSFAFLIGLSLPILTWRKTESKKFTLLTLLLVLGWLGLTAGLTFWSGFRSFEPPPPFLLTVNLGLVGVLMFLLSPLGTQIIKKTTLAGLILFQAFRLPLELLMHRAYTEGLMPIQMSFEGRNLDILTGITGLILGLILLKRELPKAVVWLWNIAGLGLLVNIVAVAILSTPSPFRYFHNDPPNIWVLDVPFVWLPMIMVLAAFFGHVAVARKLLMKP